MYFLINMLKVISQTEQARREDLAEILEKMKNRIDRERRQALLDEWIEDGIDPNEARARVLDELTKHTRASSFEIGETSAERVQARASDAILTRMNAAEMVREAAHSKIPGVSRVCGGDNRVRGNGDGWASKSWVDLQIEILKARGQRVPRSRDGERNNLLEIAGIAIRAGGLGMQTIADAPIATENAVNKLMVASFAQGAQSYRLFTGIRAAKDYKEFKMLRGGELSPFPVKPEGAETVIAKMPDATQVKGTIAPRAATFQLTREMVINDEMGLLGDYARRAGASAALAVEMDAYGVLTSNPTVTWNGQTDKLVSATFGNLAPGSAIGRAALSADRALMRGFKSPSSGIALNLEPHCLVTAPGSYSDAMAAAGNFLAPGADSAGEPALRQGLVKHVIDSPFITGTQRFLLSNPITGTAGVYAVFLEDLDGNPNELPHLRTIEFEDSDGVGFKWSLDYVVIPGDPYGIVGNSGA